MTSLLFLIPIALVLGFAGLMAFMWALRSGQFDDLEGAASRILFDDEPDATSSNGTRRPPTIRPRS
jgi:cbb3-type cytochrome oxidase maturation protein